jgi:hypothetical protein
MKVVVHTKYGKFESLDVVYDEEQYEYLRSMIFKINESPYFHFESSEGTVYFPQGIIQDSVFIIEK